MATPSPESVTAAVLVIGDEILSGRTKDKNIGTIADYLTGMGIDLREVRVVPDVEAEIVGGGERAAARATTYVFSTGGIGPTHDDITADAVAKALRRRRSTRIPAPSRCCSQRIKPEDLNPARRRMARIPAGADARAERRVQGAGLHDRQRGRHGRRAGRHAGHAGRRHRAAPAGPARR